MLNLNECLELRTWLNGRIRYLKQIPHVKKTIQDLNLSTRAYNALINHNLNTIEDILQFGTDKISILRNVGQKTAIEIINAIATVC